MAVKPGRSPSGRFIDWPAVVAAARNKPSVEQLLLPNAPAHLAKYVRLRRHPALELADGTLTARVAQTYEDEDGTVRGNVFICYTPGGILSDTTTT